VLLTYSALDIVLIVHVTVLQHVTLTKLNAFTFTDTCSYVLPLYTVLLLSVLLNFLNPRKKFPRVVKKL